MGWNAVGSYGNTIVPTPNIDRLTKEGAKFTAAYALPQCSPTRFAFMTGQWEARTNHTAVIFEKHGMPQARMIQPESNRKLDKGAMNVARMLGHAGYHVHVRQRRPVPGLGQLPPPARQGLRVRGRDPRAAHRPLAGAHQGGPGNRPAGPDRRPVSHLHGNRRRKRGPLPARREKHSTPHGRTRWLRARGPLHAPPPLHSSLQQDPQQPDPHR